jgi:hypothetical protein
MRCSIATAEELVTARGSSTTCGASSRVSAPATHRKAARGHVAGGIDGYVNHREHKHVEQCIDHARAAMLSPRPSECTVRPLNRGLRGRTGRPTADTTPSLNELGRVETELRRYADAIAARSGPLPSILERDADPGAPTGAGCGFSWGMWALGRGRDRLERWEPASKIEKLLSDWSGALRRQTETACQIRPELVVALADAARPSPAHLHADGPGFLRRLIAGLVGAVALVPPG